MNDIPMKEFWEAVAADGPVPYDQLTARVAEVLEDNPQWARLSGNDTTVLYSGRMGEASTTAIANDLADRGSGTLGIIDNTPAGQALGGMTEALSDGTLETRYGDYIDFTDAPMTSTEWGIRAASSDPAVKGEAWAFSGDLYDTFKPSSDAFAGQVEGRVITVTPDADIRRDFRQIEVPRIVEGLEDGRITHVNGIPASDVLSELEGVAGEARLDRAFENFNESFVENVHRLDLDVHVGNRTVDGQSRSVNVLDATDADLDGLGAGDNARLSDPELDGLRPLDINGSRAVPGNSTDANRGAADPTSDPTPAPSQTADSGPRYTTDQLHSGTPVEQPRSLAEINADITRANDAGNLRGFAADPQGSTSFLIDTQTSQIYTVTDGTVSHVSRFENSQDAGRAFGGLLREAGESFPDAFKGLPGIHNSLGGLGAHIDDMARPAWRRALGSAGDEIADLAGKGSKILGPLGVAAAGYEVYTLETKLQDFEEFGLVPQDAMLAYRAVLTAHAAQATVDPSLLGGELVVQAAHDEWARQYGISDEVAEALEPGSLLEDLNDAGQWLEDQARAAGMAVEDYAVSRWNNPELIGNDLRGIRDAAWNAGVDAVNTIGDGVDAVSDYGSSRWNDPSLLIDDANRVNGTIQGWGRDTYNYLFGDDEPTGIETGIQNGGNQSQTVPQTVPYGDAIEQFSDDRAMLQEMDPASELPQTRLANHSEAEAVLTRLNQAGIERFPAEAIAGDTPQERMSNLLTQARDIDRFAATERTADAQLEMAQNTPIPSADDDMDYSIA